MTKPKQAGDYGAARRFSIPVECRRIVLGVTERLVPSCRDAVGVIDIDKLTCDVAMALPAEEPDADRLVRRHAYLYLIHQLVHEFGRMSKAPYVVQHREQVTGERQAKDRTRVMRRLVSFVGPDGKTVFKERLMLTKVELTYVARDYRKRAAADVAVAEWAEEAHEQMELAGLGDNAIVGKMYEEVGSRSHHRRSPAPPPPHERRSDTA